ncbi:toll/interleukin-1 receptor domain-containing protein [Luteimonas sp. 22616]|uniref:toll/interleukin-1 receptor domain-containing protein n=1 Tax=Luteimonas sp. 22616 TaxID=3453951 RepID=UPI003F86F491
MALYEVAIFGEPSLGQDTGLKQGLMGATQAFQLSWGNDLVVHDNPPHFAPAQRTTAVAVYFGGAEGDAESLRDVLDPANVTVIPVASTEGQVPNEIPAELRFLNCVLMDRDGIDRLVSTVLECLGLLRRQRRVFLSYRRKEGSAAALQLFDLLSARGYEVFLDTHSVARAVDFQETLWHKLCDVDVMVMLETATYFESTWTTEEFGRALSKNIGVLRVQWPDATPSIDTQTCSRVEIVAEELDAAGGLALVALERIADQLERFRSLCYAVRRISVMTQLIAAVESLRGRVLGVGPHFTMRVQLENGGSLSVSPVIGVPNSGSLHEAMLRAEGQPSAVLYDHVGVMPSWNEHLQWLGQNIPRTYWIRSSQAAQDLAGWVAP